MELVSSLGISLAPLDPSQANFASEAFLRFGKGRHPAKLNLGDCFSYALAKSLQAPLLYKGEDFAKTDIVAATAAGVRP
jgi:ribonuclease VapC